MTRITLALGAAVLVGLTACGDGGRTDAAVSKRPDKSVRVVAVADIACAPKVKASPQECQQAATAKLAARLRPAAALLPGDLQYENGAADEWAAFDATWGRLPFALHPAAGNHEYGTPRAVPYYNYFGSRAGKAQSGWYAFDLGAWRVYALNSNCTIVGCTEGTAQQDWLRKDLAANPRACVLAFWHHPRFSSGLHGDSPELAPIWATLQQAGADLVIEGHDHHYERFDRRSADGAVDPAGIASFVVGTGGKSTYPVIRREPGSRRIVQFRFGVLGLTLRGTGWSWRYRTIDGALRDAGSARCR